MGLVTLAVVAVTLGALVEMLYGAPPLTAVMGGLLGVGAVFGVFFLLPAAGIAIWGNLTKTLSGKKAAGAPTVVTKKD